MAFPLVASSDVETVLLRPLTAEEAPYVDQLCSSASSLLRNQAPSVDNRIARFERDPTDPGGLDPGTVSLVLAGVIKRYIANPNGVVSESVGPFSVSYALRGDKAPRGVIDINDEDMRILFPNRKRLRAGMIRTRPALAPRPVGRYGPMPNVDQFGEAIVTWRGAEMPIDANDPELALPPDWVAE